MFVTMPTIYVATVLLKAMLQMHAILLRITSVYQAYQICLKHVFRLRPRNKVALQDITSRYVDLSPNGFLS